MKVARILISAACVMAMAGVAFGQDAEAPENTGWDMTVSLGGSLTDGNSDTMTVNGSVGATRKAGHNEYDVGVTVNYGETETTTTEADGTESTDTETNVQNVKAHAIYRRTLEHMFLYSDNSVLHDDIAALEYQATLGIGAGRRLIENDELTVSAEAGISYVDEAFTDDTDDQFGALRVDQTAAYKLSDTAKVWESVEYLLRSDDSEDYRVNAEIGIEAAISTRGNMAMRVVARDRYDNMPPDDVEKNDLSLIGSIVWKL